MMLRRGEPLESTARIGPVAAAAVKPFDLDPSQPRPFRPYVLPELPEFQIGLIIGGSGSGKSLLLGEIGEAKSVEWSDDCIAEHFDDAAQVGELLAAVGLNSVPTWLLKYSELSVGQKFRADLARRLESGAVIDEFTSVVDRNVAISCSRSVSRYIRLKGLTSVVFATCHRDVARWLEPDWIIDTDSGEFYTGDFEPVSWHSQFINEELGSITVA